MRRRTRSWHLLLAIPIVMPLLTPVYNRVDPEIFGLPFFYAYQLFCIVVAMVVITTVYLMTKDSGS